MIKQEYHFGYEVYDSISELPEADRQLLNQARQITAAAYAPYSRFLVGATALLANGAIVNGTNQENASYPVGICAERVAIFAASSQQPGEAIEAIAIAAQTESFELSNPVTPCGSCRQVMAEYQNLSGQPIRVIMKGMTRKIWVVDGVEDLLPLMFHADRLKK